MNLVSLEKLKARQRARITSLRGEKKIVQRLSDLGLTPDCEVTVLRNESSSPLDIKVRRTRLAIAQDIAKCVLVEIIL
jgi:Fe2+ transport system protein FeoA